jgi:hypothetical protein
MAVGTHDAVIYRGGTWSSPSQIVAEAFLKSVSCASAVFCVAVAEHVSGGLGGLNYGEALTYNGSTWSPPVEIPSAPDYLPFDVGSVSCASSSFCMAAALFQGGAAPFEGGVWGAWTPIERNGDFSSISCASASFCVIASYVGQAFTYTAPAATVTSTTSTTTSTISHPTSPPIAKHKPRVNRRTGEITLEYAFAEPGEAEAYGEVVGETASARSSARGGTDPQGAFPADHAALQKRRRCKKGYVAKGRKCVKSTPLRYKRTTLHVRQPGTYTFHLTPGARALAALRNGKSLTVRAILAFTPEGTNDHIRATTKVVVRVQARRRKPGVKGKR